jgi:hypothetical protein
MKKTFILLTAAVILAVAQKLSAQTFGGGISITSSTNAPLVEGGTVNTNTTYMSFPSKTVTLSQISNTNETAVFSYGVKVIGANGTNVVLIASITNSFALPAGTNQSGTGTWTTNVPQQTIPVQIVPYAQVDIGSTNSNTIYVP